MPKTKKKGEETPEEPSSPIQGDDGTEEWMSKYLGENQMTWFVGIIKTHAKKALRETMPELERSLNEKVVKVQLKAAEDVEELKSENKKLRRMVEKLQFQLHKKDAKINELVVKIDCIEQKDFINEVQMVGLDESTSEEGDMRKILKVAKEKMGVKLKKTDVKAVTRLGKKSSDKVTPRDLVVTFKDQATREVFYNNRKKLVLSKVPQSNIYVASQLNLLPVGLKCHQM